jgi:hypothetical protein
MAVKSYKRSEKLQLAKNFKLDEFKCKCGKCDPILVDEALVTWLQKIRDHFGKSVNINSAYRCEKHNADPKVGGSKTSHHPKGKAADIRVEGITPVEVAKYAESIGIQRIGLYDTFVHIGSATTKSFWKGHNKVIVDTFSDKPKTVNIELPVLKRGMKNDSVEALQAILGIERDGSFGGDTENALIEYQKKNKLEGDGRCGKDTWSRLLGVN